MEPVTEEMKRRIKAVGIIMIALIIIFGAIFLIKAATAGVPLLPRFMRTSEISETTIATEYISPDNE